MSPSDVSSSPAGPVPYHPPGSRGRPTLSWPPPGLEGLQGKLWRAIALVWSGGVVLVLPLLWALAVEQPDWSFGPFGPAWEVTLGLAVAGLFILLGAVVTLVSLFRKAARAADAGYGSWTLGEVAADLRRDTGFLVQGRRHFARFSRAERDALVHARLRSAVLLLAGGLWLPAGFALAVLLAARGFLTPSGVWLLTLAPAAMALVASLLLVGRQGMKVDASRRHWVQESGGEAKLLDEMRGWQAGLDGNEDAAVGAGPLGRGRSFRRAAMGMVALFVLVLVPTATLAVSSAVGPLLSATAIPTFLSVQEMAGATEVLRPWIVEADPAVDPQAAGAALHNLAFVGGARPDAMERAPRTRHAQPWFPDGDRFPDPFAELAAADLMAVPLRDRPQQERDALGQAAAHPAHGDFETLARASLADIVSTRWTIPFPDTATVFTLPWPRFQALRTAALAHVARASVELDGGRAGDAEETLREVVSAGFVLVDQGPTLLDNLTGVVVANLGGDALEAFYTRRGRTDEAERLHWSRRSASDAARKARVGIDEMDVHTLLVGIPALVEREDALRGLRWEYLATFNLLAPCINLHKMVFGPGETYDAWIGRAESRLVRMPGEAAFFELARAGAFGAREDQPRRGVLTRMLTLTLGEDTRPGSCARVIESLEKSGSLQ